MDPGNLLPPPSWSDEPANLEPHQANASDCAAEALQTLQPRADVPRSSMEEVENRTRNGQGFLECHDDTSVRETNATESQGIVRIQSRSEGHVPQGVGFDATTREAQSEGQPLQEASFQSYAEATIASAATKNHDSLKVRPPSSSPRNLTGRRMNLYTFSVQHTPATPPDISCGPVGGCKTVQPQGANARGPEPTSGSSPVPRSSCGIVGGRSSSVPLPEPAPESPRAFAGRIPAQTMSRVAVSDPAFTQPHEPDGGDQLWHSLPKGITMQPPPGPRPNTVRPRTAAAASHEAANIRQPYYTVSARPQSSVGHRTVVFSVPEPKHKPFKELLDRSSMYRSRISQSWSGDTGVMDARPKPPYRTRAMVSDGPGYRARSIATEKSFPQPPKLIRACSASPPRAPRATAPQDKPDEHVRRIEIARSTGKICVSLEPEIEEARKLAAQRRQQEKQQKCAELRRAVKEDKEMLQKSKAEASRVRSEMQHDSSIYELKAVTRKNNQEFQIAEKQRLKQRFKVHMQRVQQAGPAVWGNSYLTAEEKEAMRRERLEKLERERDVKRGKEDARVRAANHDLKYRLSRVSGSLAGTTIRHAERQLQVQTWTRQVKTEKMEKQLNKIHDATIRELYRRFIRGKITATEEQAKRWAEVAYSSRLRLNHTPATQQ